MKIRQRIACLIWLLAVMLVSGNLASQTQDEYKQREGETDDHYERRIHQMQFRQEIPYAEDPNVPGLTTEQRIKRQESFIRNRLEQLPLPSRFKTLEFAMAAHLRILHPVRFEGERVFSEYFSKLGKRRTEEILDFAYSDSRQLREVRPYAYAVSIQPDPFRIKLTPVSRDEVAVSE